MESFHRTAAAAAAALVSCEAALIFKLTIQPLPSGAVQMLTVKSNTITAGTRCFSFGPITADVEIADDRRGTD